MKTILLILLIIYSSHLLGQNDKKTNGEHSQNKGYVFVDGKYIEPPYNFIHDNGKILVNRTIIIKNIIYYMGNPQTNMKFPGYFPNTLSSGDEAINYINPKTVNLLRTDIVTYYFDKFEEVEASDSVIEYVCKIPHITCTEKKPLMIKFDNQTEPVAFSFVTAYNRKKHPQSEEQRANNVINKYIDKLNNGGCLFFNNQRLIFSLPDSITSKSLINDTNIFKNNMIDFDNLNIKLKKEGKVPIPTSKLLEKDESNNINERYYFLTEDKYGQLVTACTAPALKNLHLDMPAEKLR